MDPSASSLVSKITLLGINNFLSIVARSTGDKPNTFCDSKEFISFFNAEVHFSGVGDFAIFEMEFGTYTV